jgi:ribosomal protein S27AE
MSCSVYPKPSPKLPHSTNDGPSEDARTPAKPGFDGSGITRYGTPIVLINGETSEPCFARRSTRIYGEKTMYQAKTSQQWEEAMKQHLQTCPQCGQVWLVFGLRENETYTCGTCRHRFIILHTYCSENQQHERPTLKRR